MLINIKWWGYYFNFSRYNIFMKLFDLIMILNISKCNISYKYLYIILMYNKFGLLCAWRMERIWLIFSDSVESICVGQDGIAAVQVVPASYYEMGTGSMYLKVDEPLSRCLQ